MDKNQHKTHLTKSAPPYAWSTGRATGPSLLHYRRPPLLVRPLYATDLQLTQLPFFRTFNRVQQAKKLNQYALKLGVRTSTTLAPYPEKAITKGLQKWRTPEASCQSYGAATCPFPHLTSHLATAYPLIPYLGN
ncbi:Hypothetical predicted protein [Pelobates cultripes]|uniref:Uncharacterized protein n=1 Tax=Pelobates cultripes TaxID=61616 RepID=A0AAD1SKA7_PELCU|nr:Hypothetical predicted protein [Pelobates cultripes]